jgi:hypothetical protein
MLVGALPLDCFAPPVPARRCCPIHRGQWRCTDAPDACSLANCRSLSEINERMIDAISVDQQLSPHPHARSVTSGNRARSVSSPCTFLAREKRILRPCLILHALLRLVPHHGTRGLRDEALAHTFSHTPDAPLASLCEMGGSSQRQATTAGGSRFVSLSLSSEAELSASPQGLVVCALLRLPDPPPQLWVPRRRLSPCRTRQLPLASPLGVGGGSRKQVGAAVGVAFISSLACRKPLHFSNDYFALLLRLPLRSPQSRGAGAHLVAHDGRAPRALSGWATPRESRWAGRVALPFSSLAFQKKCQSLLHSFNVSPLAQASTAQPSRAEAPGARLSARGYHAPSPRGADSDSRKQVGTAGLVLVPFLFLLLSPGLGWLKPAVASLSTYAKALPTVTLAAHANHARSPRPIRDAARPCTRPARRAPPRAPASAATSATPGSRVGVPVARAPGRFPPSGSPRTRITRAPHAL